MRGYGTDEPGYNVPPDEDAVEILRAAQYQIWEESPKVYKEIPGQLVGSFVPTNPAWEIVFRALFRVKNPDITVHPRSAEATAFLNQETYL